MKKHEMVLDSAIDSPSKMSGRINHADIGQIHDTGTDCQNAGFHDFS